MNALEVRNLSKLYRLYRTPGQRLKEIILRKPLHRTLVALEGLTFSVARGESFGIIGENGAGKSTLLKIIANTLKPTTGEVTRHGRVAALLELGAGFNPELTGEENIFLNAYLMGLTKNEIEAKKEEIIQFSELGEFIHQPVKTYSSGMHVRLAFSIATSVNPDLLVVDEALAVGDQHFQKKCVDRMMSFKKEGKTILFCSHALYLVQELCERALWLRNGRMEKTGPAHKVINAYTDWVRAKDASMELPAKERAGDSAVPAGGPLWIAGVGVVDEDGHELEYLRSGQEVRVETAVGLTEGSPYRHGHVGFALYRNDEEAVFAASTKMDGLPALDFSTVRRVVLRFPALPLLAGQYYFTVGLLDENAIHFYDVRRTRMVHVENLRGELGIVRLDHDWHAEGLRGVGPARE